MIACNFREACGSQRRLNLLRRIVLHAINDLFKLQAGGIGAVRFIADHKITARLQHFRHLGEAFLQSRPEVDGFKCCCEVKRPRGKPNIRHVALQDFTPSRGDHRLVVILRFFHGQGGIIHRRHMRFRILLKQFARVPSAAAAEIDGFFRRNVRQMRKTPIRHLGMTGIHAAQHDLSKEPFRLSGLTHIVLKHSHFHPSRNLFTSLANRSGNIITSSAWARPLNSLNTVCG